MNRHQILTGACNGGDCYALGSVEGVNFIAYASGCDIVILASSFQRVVTIPGVLRGNIKVSCVDCSIDTGKVAASFGRKVHIFEPTPSNTNSSHKLDYRWFPTGQLETDCFVRCLSWNSEAGSRLLTGGEVIQMWEFVSSPPQGTPIQTGPTHSASSVHFSLDNVADEDDPVRTRLVNAIADQDWAGAGNGELEQGSWECVWKVRPSNPVTHIKFSPDSFVFASLGKNERLVKIWYEDQKVSQGLMRADSVLSPKKSSVHYTFVYISHPRAVTGFEWRQTSKYMPRGSVANMLVTSCEDNVCRIFVETILPDAGLLDLEQFDPSASPDIKYHTQRHKKRFVNRLKSIKHTIHKRRKHPKASTEPLQNGQPLNSSSVHDFHKFAIHHNGLSPVLHFHLACSINPDTDIPLLPIIGSKEDANNKFRLHWLNNKDLEFTLEAEKLLQDLHQRLLAEEGGLSTPSGSHSEGEGEGQEEDEEEEEEEPAEDELDETGVQKSSKSKKKKKSKEKGLGSSHSSMSSNEDGMKEENPQDLPIHLLQSGVIDRLDRKIDSLLLDWHGSPDYVFSIHPVDGSFLVWLIDHLDESTPFTFHQAQASFSSRLPRAFPVADARSMASSLLMYCNYSRMDIRTIIQASESQGLLRDEGNGHHHRHQQAHRKGGTGKVPTGTSNSGSGGINSMLIPSIHMVTKHTNGSLNQWQVSFAENSKFQSIVSVSHVSRACGHRFRTNSAACHPVLPLLLTTSHHNLPFTPDMGSSQTEPETPEVEQIGPTFCSELILWQVVPVGPLSKTGGITELCRINNSCHSAFTSVAWVPTLLPSSALGSYSNSPSALFVASDGQCLRLFQAIIDARSLLMEKSQADQSSCSNLSQSSSSSFQEPPSKPTGLPSQFFNMISLQSSTRPGAILELDAISDAFQDWQNIQLIHIFQEQLITGEAGVGPGEAVVDLSGQHTFNENFFLVVLEKGLGAGNSCLHMWKINIDSKPNPDKSLNGTYDLEQYAPTVDSYNDELSPGGMNFRPKAQFKGPDAHVMTMSVRTSKVCCQMLSLPENVDLVSASVAAGHLSSASIYPACYAPYLLATACSDGKVRFWRCNVTSRDLDSAQTHECCVTSYEFAVDDGDLSDLQPQVNCHKEEERSEFTFDWQEWKTSTSTQDKSSAIRIPGQPIAVSCAYSGRVAVAYRSDPIRSQPEHPGDKLVNLKVVIEECESTGGSEWVHEDTIELNNIKIPDPKNEIDMYMLQEIDAPLPLDEDGILSNPGAQTAVAYMTRTRSVPSLSTIQSVKRSITEQGNRKGVLQQKCLVQLDWVSSEDGSHMLTVGVGSKVLIYGQISNEIANTLKSQMGSEPESQEEKRSVFASSKRMTLNKSMVREEYQEEIKWMRFKGIELTTSDGLPPLPMHISWVRSGILVIGMDNEMQVFTQWTSNCQDPDSVAPEDTGEADKRTLTQANLATAASSLNLYTNLKPKSTFKSSLSMSNVRQMAVSTSKKEGRKMSAQNSSASKGSISLAHSDSLSNLPLLYDTGLFEAARFANPTLPQYHPKLLMELLNFGKTKRVKAILAHLVRCIAGSEAVQAVYAEDSDADSNFLSVKLHRQRSVSVRSEDNTLEVNVGGVGSMEIKSIPPLPLYALLTADRELSPFQTGEATMAQANDYRDLLDTNLANYDEEDLDAQLFSSSPDNASGSSRRGRLLSGGRQAASDPYQFSPQQAGMLRELLFKLNLPGLSGNDQFYLAALAEVVGSFNQDLSDAANDESRTKEQGSMDECGLRFLLAMRQYQCLVNTLPPVQRLPLLKEGIRTFYLVWAFHSEATQELLSSIPCVKSDEPVWEELKLYGVGWWLTNMTMLKTLMLKVANTAFKKDKKPMEAAIFYLAMKKKAVVKGLFKTVDDDKMMRFFSSDFSNEKNKKIAMKNAFHLLSKGQYQHAAALFFLAGQVDNAVNVIVDKMNDIQLAIVLCRLHDDQPSLPDSVRRLYFANILGLDPGGDNYQASEASPDPFLRSMALWQLKDYESSLQTLLETNVGRKMPAELDRLVLTPPVFNFYNFLRTHPLLVRLRLASSSRDSGSRLVPGFATKETVGSDPVATLDQVTPSERRLFFAAAHAHFQNGCPLVAIEVMRKLPNEPLLVEEDLRQMDYFSKRKGNASAHGWKEASTMSIEGSWEDVINAKKPPASDTASSIVCNGKVNGVDSSSSLDWGMPNHVRFSDEPEELVLDLGGSSSEEDDDDEDGAIQFKARNDDGKEKAAGSQSNGSVAQRSGEREAPNAGLVDYMAQQYKFVACLKVLMEELGNLATGFEVDGGQLRHQLYIWLEKEVEVLRVLCNYGQAEEGKAAAEAVLDSSFEEGETALKRPRTASMRSDVSGKASLHEAIKADRLDLQSKVERMARRKAWLKDNQHLLRTLASYCILQGSGGGGLASVRMELLLLLQELQQERPAQQLLSPLPFPTTLPLLSANITSCRSVIADPVQYLQCNIQDLLKAITEMPLPPGNKTDICLVSLLRDLSVSLSSCIYQSLCDSDSFNVALGEAGDVGIDGFISPEFSYPTSHLMAGVKRSRHKSTSAHEEVINTPPAKWPGVASLKVLLAREKDEDAPKINILLTESLVAVYVSLLVTAFSMYDSQMLYRLVANRLDTQAWATLFGGGMRTSIKTDKNPINLPKSQDDNSKHRMLFTLRFMTEGSSCSSKSVSESKETVQEKFVPPELSMVNYFMSKPIVANNESIVDYDSDDSVDSESELDSEDDEDDDDDFSVNRPTSLTRKKQRNTEHSDPGSYSWCLIRYASMRAVIDNLTHFLPQIGVEMSELPNVSPSLHAVMKTLSQWEDLLVSRLDLFWSPPADYIPGLVLDVNLGQPKSKLQALFNPDNSPFPPCQASLPIKRLWFYLLRQENLRDIFLRYVYKKKRDPEDSEIGSMRTSSSDNEQQVRDPMKLVHKEQDIITAFAINQANRKLLSLSTQKEVVELDIGYLLKPPVWLEDDNEYDIEMLRNPTPGPEVPEFLVVQTPQDTPQPVSGSQTPSTPYMPSPSHSQASLQTGRGTNVVKSFSSLGVNHPLYPYSVLDRSRRLLRPILRRPVLGVRRIGSHPVLPHYLTGGSDGAVKLWEWGHDTAITTLRQPGSFPKVTKVLFNQQGNKCCVSDTEGSICLWQVGLGSNFNKPIMSLQCHNKTTSDFQFVGSSSLIATAGQSSEHKNVCLWDTLLPPRSSLVHAFQCHEQGSPAVVYAARQHLLISGGRKGEICIFDLRQRVLKHTFQAHDAPIKCLALDPDEDYFITGSAEGDIKVWGLKIHQLIFSFPGEHSKTTFFKNVGSTSGVAQMSVGYNNHLFSCGVDGSMKLRQLPERELVVHHWA